MNKKSLDFFDRIWDVSSSTYSSLEDNLQYSIFWSGDKRKNSIHFQENFFSFSFFVEEKWKLRHVPVKKLFITLMEVSTLSLCGLSHFLRKHPFAPHEKFQKLYTLCLFRLTFCINKTALEHFRFIIIPPQRKTFLVSICLVNWVILKFKTGKADLDCVKMSQTETQRLNQNWEF